MAFEKPGVRWCKFCKWKLHVTEVDRVGDTIKAVDRHLQRHAEALTAEAAERAVFDALVARIKL